MPKLIAAAAVFLLCAAVGAVNAERYRLRIRSLDDLAADPKELENSLRFERTDIGATAMKLAARGKCRAFWQAIGSAMACGDLPAAYRSAADKLLLGEKERGILDEFMLAFGSGDIETELSRLALAEARLKETGEGTREKLENRRKLCGTLSVLLGAALALTVL